MTYETACDTAWNALAETGRTTVDSLMVSDQLDIWAHEEGVRLHMYDNAAGTITVTLVDRVRQAAYSRASYRRKVGLRQGRRMGKVKFN